MRPQKGKQKIFAASAKLFEQQGYFATTIEEITQEAGVSKGLVYNYFKSKEELLAALVEEATDKMKAVAFTLEQSGSLNETLNRFLENYFTFLETEKQFLKLQLTLMMMPEFKEVIGDQQKKRAVILLETVENWFKQAETPDFKLKARLFLAMLDGVAMHYLHTYEKYSLKPMKKHLIQATTDMCKTII